MGRYWIDFDAAGYKAPVAEPGYDKTYSGTELYDAFVKAEGALQGGARPNFFGTPWSQWTGPRPRQLSPNWDSDPRLVDHVIKHDLWTFAPGVSVDSWAKGRTPDGNPQPDNEWIVIRDIPDTSPPLDHLDYTALFDAAGVSAPSGIITVGMAHNAPVGLPLVPLYTPYFRWGAFPDSVVVFGCSNLAFICYREVVYVLRSPGGDKKTWEFRWLVYNGAPGGMLPRQLAANERAPLSDLRIEMRSLLTLWMGPKRLFCFPDRGEPGRPVVRELGEDGQVLPLPEGPWWVGAAPGDRVVFQMQVVGYEEADNTPLNLPTPKIHFDLGSGYTPTEQPEFWFDGLLPFLPGGAEPTLTPSSAPAANSITWTSPDLGSSMELQILDADGFLWNSNGSVYRGGFYIKITPSTAVGVDGAYTTPQLRQLSIRFPEKLEARPSTTVRFDDSLFIGFTAETGYEDPEAKRVSIDLNSEGVAAFVANNLDLRDNYAVEIWEDANGDGLADTLRVVGWVESPDLQAVRLENDDFPEPLQAVRVSARGLLSRAKQPWLYLPQVITPSNGNHVEQLDAVKVTLSQSGVDVANPGEFAVPDRAKPDPWAGTPRGRLPGSEASQSDGDGTKNENPWGPSWDEERLSYAVRIARDWAGWVLRETFGKTVWYHPNLLIALAEGFTYFVSASVYRSHGEAAAAGVPGQCILAQGIARQQTPPAGNIIRVTGTDSDGQLVPHLIEREPRAFSNPADVDYYTGQPQVYAVVSKLAVSQNARRQLARMALWRLRRRRITQAVEVPLEPWRMANPVDAGVCVDIAGRGVHLVTHVEVQVYNSRASGAWVRSRLSCERLPADAAAAGSAGSYPGAGA